MANLSSEISNKLELRPCMVNGQKALFHRWGESVEIVAPSPMKGGHKGGTMSYIVGVVEFENGQVTTCLPHTIRFVDNEIEKYCFKEVRGNGA